MSNNIIYSKAIKNYAEKYFHGDVLAARQELRELYLYIGCTGDWKEIAFDIACLSGNR